MDELKKILMPSNADVEAVYETNLKDRAKARKAAELIGLSFVWEDSAEGMEFWDSVHERLMQISENGRLK